MAQGHGLAGVVCGKQTREACRRPVPQALEVSLVHAELRFRVTFAARLQAHALGSAQVLQAQQRTVRETRPASPQGLHALILFYTDLTPARKCQASELLPCPRSLQRVC